jgi:predicted nucleic acid-binding protein
MILADTSVWVDHLRNGNETLKTQLHKGEVLIHPFIIGELACGSLKKRAEILKLLGELPGAVIAEHREVLGLIDSKNLHGKGIGWVDVHLIASAFLSRAKLFTMDKPLRRVAAGLGIGAKE